MSKARKFFSNEDMKAIETAVHAAEEGTCGEVVPVVVESSSSYDWLAYRTALLGLLVGSACAAYFHFFHPFVFEFWATFLFQGLGVVSGWLLSRTRWGVRVLLDERLMAEEVREAAQAAFLRHGLVDTRDRTGVLVFVSLLERRVQILADRGIHEKVGEVYWQSEVDKIAAGLGAGHPVEVLVESIRGIGATLRAHFPIKPDDKDELPNQLRFD
jgi:putative membrane protein